MAATWCTVSEKAVIQSTDSTSVTSQLYPMALKVSRCDSHFQKPKWTVYQFLFASGRFSFSPS